MEIFTFKTKFANDKKYNYKKCVILKDYENGQLLIEFLEDKKQLVVYDTELIEER